MIALIVFGPDELPKIASQVSRALRDLRRIAESATDDLREGLGPEFADIEIEDLNPKRFVYKHLSGDLNAAHQAQQQPARQAHVCHAGQSAQASRAVVKPPSPREQRSEPVTAVAIPGWES